LILRRHLNSCANGSHDLAVFLQACNNSCKKRLDTATKKTAAFLNASVFGLAGPVRILAKTLGATGEHQGVCLLDQYIRPGYSRPIFPVSDIEAAGGPLVKGRYQPELHLALGLMRIFNAELNSTQPGGQPVFNWHNPPEKGGPMIGAGGAAVYGPMSISVWECTIANLSSKHKSLLDNARTVEGVVHAVNASFNR